MDVLVTGGAGFIGSAIVRHLLKAGYTVRVLARDQKSIPLIEGLDIEIVEGDITCFHDVERDRKSTRLNSSHSAKSRMPSSA